MMKVIRRVFRNYKKFTLADKVELYSSIIGVILFVWLGLSWLEIGFNSLEYGYEYNRMNLLVMLFDAFGGLVK